MRRGKCGMAILAKNHGLEARATVKRVLNHRWTQMNTDAKRGTRASGKAPTLMRVWNHE
jgi:hypothetical protein